jgi:hypothetical protein
MKPNKKAIGRRIVIDRNELSDLRQYYDASDTRSELLFCLACIAMAIGIGAIMNGGLVWIQ